MADERIKILYIGAVLRRDMAGGEPIIAKETIDELKKIGYEVESAFYGPDEDSKVWKVINLIYSIHSMLRVLFLKTDSLRPAVSYYRKIIKLNNPDLIISQYDYDTSIIEAAKLENKKIITYTHSWWPICPKASLLTQDMMICNGYLNKECKKCIPSRYNEGTKSDEFTARTLSHMAKMATKLFLRNSNIKIKMDNRINKLNSSDSIIVLSEQMKNLFISNGIDGRKISILLNGVSCEKFPYRRYDKQKIVLYAGGKNNNEIKGHKFFIKVAENIKKAYPEIRFVAAGKFSSSDKDTKYVEYPGILERNELMELMCMSRVTVVPSIWNEPFSMVTIESMASGTPVVAFDVGILKEIIGDGIGGFVVPRGDISEATQKVIELLNDDDLFEKMSKNARDRVCEVYSETHRIYSLDKIIKTLVDSSN